MRLRRLEDELAGQIELVWRSYLLRPEPGPPRELEKFREYTRGWARPAADADAGTFRVWQSDAGPPSYSVPPHVAARAAAEIGQREFHALHDRLLHAYFAENRDITDTDTLRALWGEVGLPAAAFARTEDPALREAVLADHREAMELGIHGVPAVRVAPNPVATVGAHPLDVYRRWFLKALGSER